MDRESEILQQAEALLQAGQAQDALPRLVALVKTNPRSEAAWLLLSRALTEPQKQRDCLQQVLKINPANADARARLGKLGSSSPPAKVSPFTSLTAEDLVGFPPPMAPPATPPVSPAVNQPPWPAPGSAAPGAGPQSPGLSAPLLTTSPAAKPLAPADAQAQGRPKRQRPAPIGEIVMGSLLLVATLGCVVAAFFAVRAFVANQQVRAPVLIPADTPGNYPTLPPTWTATPPTALATTPGVTVLASGSATRGPTATSTLPPPNATDQAAMDIIEAQVADLRGLSIEGNVPTYLISQYKLETVAKGLLISPDDQARLKQTARVYTMLGLIKPTYDLTNYALNSQIDSIGGFYVPWTKDLFVVVGETGQFSGMEQFVFSHEYDHALTDQHFHFSQQGVYPACLGDEQRCAAVRALVEGDATLLMQQWWHQYASPQDYVDLNNYQAPKQALPEEYPPPFALRDADFPYKVGTNFVKTLYDKGNWAEVNRAYANLPQSTAQIMHPDLYLAGQAPVPVPARALTDTLGEGWNLLESNSLGEWMTYLVLGYGADLASQVDDTTAAKAADGWAGDSYQVYANDVISQTVLAAEWKWTTTDDAREFKSAMKFYLNARWRGAKTTGPAEGDCWEANNQTSCFFSKNKASLWLIAPNQAVLNSVLAQYPDFP